MFGPPIAGFLTVIADVRLPFLVFGVAVAASSVSLRHVVIDEPGRRGQPVAVADRRVLRRLVVDRRVIAAILVVVSFRYSIGVFEPLWATYLDSLGASTMVVTISLTVFALPMLIIARPAGRLSDRYGGRAVSVLAAAATVPLMAAYGFVGLVPIVMLMAIPHGVMEAIQSPAPSPPSPTRRPSTTPPSAQGLAEAAGSAAAAIGAFTAAPLFDALGAGPAWLIAGIVMAVLLTTSAVLDRPRFATNRIRGEAVPSPIGRPG